jgi:hypothetical protein
MNGFVGWTFTLTCCKCCFDFQSPYRTCVSPQFHVIFDDDFTTVPYLRTATIPPYWADLICASSKLHAYTERQVDTWQSLPELIPENGDFMSEQTEIPNTLLGSHTNNTASSNSEGATFASIPAHLPMS